MDSYFFASETAPIMERKSKELVIMKTIDWKNACKKVCEFASSTFVLGLTYSLMFSSPRKRSDATTNYDYLPASYSKAVKAIVDSDMLDSYKRDVMEILKRDGDSDYYKAVISIVNGSMLDSYKRDMVESLSEDD